MKKTYYIYLNNRLYYDSFTRKQKIAITKAITNDDIIQSYKENGELFIQLKENKKILDIINEV